jgi:hypothetical protein
MFRRLSRDVRIASISAVCAALLAAPTGAMAAYVANADKVDNKHAVGAGASVENRAGKLVATRNSGFLPGNIIEQAPDSALLAGKTPRQLQTQWLSVESSGDVYGASPDAADVTVSRVAEGTYCVSAHGIERASVAGSIQSQVNGYTDITLVITSLYNTSACNGSLRIYTAQAGVLDDSPFTLTFVRSS